MALLAGRTIAAQNARAMSLITRVVAPIARRAAGGTAIIPAPAGSGLLFESDWATSTGTTDAALRDTDKTLPWDTANQGSVGINLNVIATGALDFPTTNVLEVTYRVRAGAGPPSCECEILDGWTVPPVNGSLYYRTYYRNSIADAEGALAFPSHHPIQAEASADGTCAEWGWKFGIDTDGTYDTIMDMPNAQDSAYRRVELNGVMQKDTTYILEWQVKRTASTTHEMHVRIGDSNASQLWSDADFVSPDGGGRTLADNPVISTTSASPCLEHVMVGNNGPDWGELSTNHLVYYGAVMVRDDDWAGAFA